MLSKDSEYKRGQESSPSASMGCLLAYPGCSQRLFCEKSQVHTHAQLRPQTQLLRVLLQGLVGKEPWATAALEETPMCLSMRCWVSQSQLMLQEVSKYFNFLHIDLIMNVEK